jgi:acyl-lipid omega-6 desaturase (Delta-12 desaturase)
MIEKTDLSPDWLALLAPYKTPSAPRSFFQLANTAVPFFLMWALMYRSLAWSYALTLLLAVPTSLLVVRLFILQHDCGHGSFFKSRRLNDAVGFAIGILTLVPYTYWRKTHAIHHATSGNLSKRTFGDIDTLTVAEYLALSPFRRLLYRLYRHPIVMLFLGPAYQFILKHRFPADAPRSWKREWASVHATNVALLAIVLAMALTIGLKRFLLIQLPVTLLAGSIGVFLFYIQHQYEGTYWRREEGWDYFDAGLKGSSHFVLPAVLQWFTGNIGIHHIHHVDSKIPNYYLPRCLRENPVLQNAARLNFRQAVRTLWMTLWDENNRRLIGFSELKDVLRRRAQAGGDVDFEILPRAWRGRRSTLLPSS